MLVELALAAPHTASEVEQPSKDPVKVFIPAAQSNMEGKGFIRLQDKEEPYKASNQMGAHADHSEAVQPPRLLGPSIQPADR